MVPRNCQGNSQHSCHLVTLDMESPSLHHISTPSFRMKLTQLRFMSQGIRKPIIYNKDPLDLLSRSVSPKLDEGGFRGVNHLVSSEDSLASFNENTPNMLKDKHPSPDQNKSLSTPSASL